MRQSKCANCAKFLSHLIPTDSQEEHALLKHIYRPCYLVRLLQNRRVQSLYDTLDAEHAEDMLQQIVS